MAEELLDIVEKSAEQKAVGSFAAVQSLMKLGYGDITVHHRQKRFGMAGSRSPISRNNGGYQ